MVSGATRMFNCSVFLPLVILCLSPHSSIPIPNQKHQLYLRLFLTSFLSLSTFAFIMSTNHTKKQQKAGIRQTEQVGIRLERELYDKLEQIANSEYRTIANVAKIAILEYIERKTAPVAA